MDSDVEVEEETVTNTGENNGEGPTEPDTVINIAEEKFGDNGSGSSPEKL